MVKLLVVSVLLLSCLRVASPRAERDLAVGRAANEGVAVEVAAGHAAVRFVGADRVRLWANAPSLDVSIGSPPRAMTIEIDNVLADAVTAPVAGFHGARPTTLTVTVRPEDFVGDRIRFSVRSPEDASADRYRFAMYADVQEAIGRVQDIYVRMNATDARFALFAGDLTEHGGRDELERFEAELRTLNFPVFMTLGNHELGQSEVPYHDYFGRGSSSFVHRNTRFTFVDSASATIDPEVYGWLDDWLRAGRDQVHIVSMHVPPIDPIGARSGSFASRNEANKVLSKLARGAVDLTLYGHVHSYYAFSNASIPAYIAGGGGAIPERMDGVGRHFLLVEVDPAAQTQSTTLVRVDGE